VVHPIQEQPHPARFRGGPAWPRFEKQILARQCWGPVPVPVDLLPYPARPEFPYFDPGRALDRRYAGRQYWRALLPTPRPEPLGEGIERADCGIWCGGVSNHFGVMIANFAMRIAQSSRSDPAMPLVFSLRLGEEPEPFFWHIIDHFGVARERVMLVRRPTRFARLDVYPQAERPYGGAPSRQHLAAMDRIAATLPPLAAAPATLFVSRSRMGRGSFAGEAYLDRAMAAAGVAVFHPQSEDLAVQLQHYRQARRLVFSEGSALYGLQLLGRVGAEVTVLTRRPGARIAVASLRPRTRSLRYFNAVRGIVHGLNRDGGKLLAKGISVIDERCLVAGLRPLGIDLGPVWDEDAYIAQRDADIAAWIAERLAAPVHRGERHRVERCLARLSLSYLQR
jgi:hypothetical protein